MDIVAQCRQSFHEDKLWPEISFDDGHVSNYQYALPILAAHNVAACFFITVGWTGRKAGYMSWAEIRSLHAAGHRIGAHGWTHALLTHCNATDLQRELDDARKTLEDKLGSAIHSMSLPGGRYDRRVVAACRLAGYSQIFTSVPRSQVNRDQLLVGRVNITAGLMQSNILDLLCPGSGALATLQHRYELKTAVRSILGDTLYARLWATVNGRPPDTAPGSIATQ
jgi:hypothetical protein